jgi:diaminopimelate decarboxylase
MTTMNDFQYREGELYCEDVPLSRIAKEVGTPCYVYSHHTLVRHFRVYDSAFQNIPHVVAFAMKANSNLAVLRLMAKEGSGVDIVSGGELFRALKAGVPPGKIVFAGVGKKPEEIRDALKADILMFNVESSAELQAINDVAASMGVKARVALRINPDIDPKTHPYISTGLKKSKFGIAADRAIEEFKAAAAFSHIEVGGVACTYRVAIDASSPLRRVAEEGVDDGADPGRAGNSYSLFEYRRRSGDYVFR